MSDRIIGPQIPAHLLAQMTSNVDDDDDEKAGQEEEDDDDDANRYGPALPPTMTAAAVEKKDSASIVVDGVSAGRREEDDGSDSDDDQVVGPMPATAGADKEYVVRLLTHEIKKAIAEEKPVREAWMTELPDKLVNYGLGPRQFRRTAAPDREGAKTAWTESPLDKQKKAILGVVDAEPAPSTSTKINKQRDEKLEKQAKELSKDRRDSLMDVHQRKRKAEVEAKPVAGERRPFNRDTDLCLRGAPITGEAAVKRLSERAGALASKFGHSDEQKYL